MMIRRKSKPPNHMHCAAGGWLQPQPAAKPRYALAQLENNTIAFKA